MNKDFLLLIQEKLGLNTSSILDSLLQAVKNGISNVRKLDDSLLELSRVSDLSARSLADVADEAYDLGEKVGKTGRQVLDAVTIFKKAGFDIGQSMQLAEDALKMTNIADGIHEAGDSARYLISIMNGYQNTSSEFSAKILDALSEVSRTQNIGFEDLADGAQSLSEAADQANVSFEQMLGALAGGYEALGDMEKTASGLATIFARLQSIRLTDEEDAVTVAELQETFHSATDGAVNVVDQMTGQLRSAYDILADLSKVWDTLDRSAQEKLAFAAGGTSQQSAFLDIMSNWESVERSVQSASNSMGSAETQNNQYLDSISGKVSQFSGALEKLSKDLIESDIIKWFVDLGTTGVKAVDSIASTLGSIETIGLGAGLLSGLKNVGSPKMFGFPIVLNIPTVC